MYRWERGGRRPIAAYRNASCYRTKRLKNNIGATQMDQVFSTVLKEMDFLDFDVRSISKGKPLDFSVCNRINQTNFDASKITSNILNMKSTPLAFKWASIGRIIESYWLYGVWSMSSSVFICRNSWIYLWRYRRNFTALCHGWNVNLKEIVSRSSLILRLSYFLTS